MRTITIRAYRPATDSSITLNCDLPCYVGDDCVELLAREYLKALLPQWELAMFVVSEKDQL
jgi:hypothetical protein